jgi:acetolactate decarboxylase
VSSKSTLIPLAAILLVTAVSFTALYELWQVQTNSKAQFSETVLYQVAPYAPFAQGSFDGNLTYAQLTQYGGFGIGTFNGMDGEMLALDGVFYQVRTNGLPRQADPAWKTPYAVVTFFKPDQTLQVTGPLNYSELTAYVDQALPSLNAIYAIKVHVTCDYAKTRSIPIQSKPYPAIAAVVANQTVFNLSNVIGTMVGFRFPDYLNGANTAGYHFHFVTDDKTAGGHMLECNISSASIEIDQIEKYVITMP